MEKLFHKFRPRIFPYANAMIVPIYIIFIPLWIISLVLFYTQSPELSSFFLLFLLGYLAIAHAASALSSLCGVKVSQDGVSGSTVWGIKGIFVTWDDIEKVKPIRLFGLRYLRLFCNSKKLPLWIPLFLNNVNEFQKLVIQYSNEGNVIREHLDESNKYRLPGLRKNLVRLIAFLVIPFIIYGASVVFYSSKAPINDLVLRSAYSEYLVEAIPIPTLPPSLCRFYIRNFSDFDINEEYEGSSLLHWALFGYVMGDPDQRQHMLDLAEFFIAKGADLNALNEWGRTCIHQAVRYNLPELVRFLLKHGADVNVLAGSKLKNLTPLAYARSLEREHPKTDRREVIQLLRENAAVE
jgi:hypothetical protein